MNPWRQGGIAAAAAAAIILGIQAYASSAALDHQDRLFMEAATRAGLFELRSGDLALQRARRADVRAYAQAAIRAHAEVRARLVAIAAAKSRSVPSAVDGAQHAALVELQKAPAEAFDALYLRKVAVGAQRAALRLFRQTARDSDDPELQAFAADVLPMLEWRLEQARMLQAAVHAPTQLAQAH